MIEKELWIERIKGKWEKVESHQDMIVNANRDHQSTLSQMIQDLLVKIIIKGRKIVRKNRSWR